MAVDQFNISEVLRKLDLVDRSIASNWNILQSNLLNQSIIKLVPLRLIIVYHHRVAKFGVVKQLNQN